MSDKRAFEVGDVVERIASSHSGMRIGDRAVVVGDGFGAHVFLDKYPYRHNIKNLKLVGRADMKLEDKYANA